MAKNTNLTTPELMQEYYRLDPLKQRVLQVAALNCNIATSHYWYGQELYSRFSSLANSLLEGVAGDNNGKKISHDELVVNLKSLCNKGFLNDQFRLKNELLFFLSKIAASGDNLDINLNIITQVNNFSLVANFDSYQKFDLNNIQCLELGDLRALNLAIHSSNPKLFDKKWDEEEQIGRASCRERV